MSTLKTVIKKRRPVNLFFTELIIALLFFSISGAVILNVFASADRKSHINAEKENAMICAQSIAEAYSVLGNADEALKTVFVQSPEFDAGSGIYTIQLDNLCKPATDGKVIMSATEEREITVSGVLSELSIVFSDGNEELFSLVCSAYISDGGEGDA